MKEKSQLEKSGKCIWVTGASSGMGKALALRLAKEGNYVIASGRRKNNLEALSVTAGGRLVPLVFDVNTNTDGLREVKKQLSEITDYLDIVICCAGICEYEDDLSFDPAMYERVFGVNFLGVIRTLHIAMPFLRASKLRPHIVTIGSLSSTAPFPRAEAYGASKAALEYFMKALRADTVHLPLDTTLVRPGFVATELTAENDFSMPFMMSAEQAADRILDGIKNKKRVVDFPRRLSWPLRLMGTLSPLWFRWVAPRVTRQRKSSWAKSLSR